MGLVFKKKRSCNVSSLGHSFEKCENGILKECTNNDWTNKSSAAAVTSCLMSACVCACVCWLAPRSTHSPVFVPPPFLYIVQRRQQTQTCACFLSDNTRVHPAAMKTDMIRWPVPHTHPCTAIFMRTFIAIMHFTALYPHTLTPLSPWPQL